MPQVTAPFATKNYAMFKALERKPQWSPSPATIAAIRREARSSHVFMLKEKFNYPFTPQAFGKWLRRMNIKTLNMRSSTDVEYGR